MSDLERREQILHRVVAGSAFAFALSILPVAQYYLTPYAPQTTPETGKVAGVSYDRTLGEVPLVSPSPDADCAATKAKDLSDLDTYLVGKQKADLASADAAAAKYQVPLQQLQATPEYIAGDATALANAKAIENLIDTDKKPYLNDMSAVESAVESQKKVVESRSCPAE